MTNRLSLLLDQSKISNPVSNTFMKEVQRFAVGGEKTAAISQLHLSLLTTSVETEQVFSAGGLFGNRTECRQRTECRHGLICEMLAFSLSAFSPFLD